MPDATVTPATGIDGCLAMLVALKDIAADYKTVMADGKVDAKDLSVLGALALQFTDVMAAVSGVKTVGAELKDLTKEETEQLAAAAFDIYATIKG